MAQYTNDLVEPATQERARWPLILVFCSMWFGLIFTETISINLLPLTLSEFTPDPSIIGLILAINPAFGFIAQPLVGIMSDRIWTPVGRRAFFIIIAAPIVAICLFLIPFGAVLWHIIVLVVIYQFFQDILFGSDHPLLADLIPPDQRTFVAGMTVACAAVAQILMLWGGMKFLVERFDERGVTYIYWIGAVIQIAFVMVAAFFLTEKPVKKTGRPKLTVKRYIMDIIGHSILCRLAIVHFLRAFALSSIAGFAVLYATKTLGITKPEFGLRWGIKPYFALVLAIPLGLVLKRLPKQWTMVVAFTLLAASCFFGYTAKAPNDLVIVAILFGLSALIQEVVFKPFFTEYLPPDIIGQLAGAMNVFYATGRTLALVLCGFMVKWTGGETDYHVIWIMSAVGSVLAIAVIKTVPDLGYIERKRQRQIAEGT